MLIAMRPQRRRWLLRAVAAAGLAVDAVVHTHLAFQYGNAGQLLGEQNLFLGAATGAVAALGLLLGVRRRWSDAIVLLISLGTLGAVVVNRYVDLGTLGPLPDLYEPLWYPEKVLSVLAEAATTVAAALLVVDRPRTR